ncbi:hypothetical protein A2706_01750 [Candidatus Peribacteria bacterium RIFCSPHIGHO2_01_FULL_51_35]|nr:MAG: hypothetical protein A2706_01750 [Candidatus Peribacteria bacterium RIFCSPHIGHO2_01_FULL_51_35]
MGIDGTNAGKGSEKEKPSTDPVEASIDQLEAAIDQMDDSDTQKHILKQRLYRMKTQKLLQDTNREYERQHKEALRMLGFGK